MVAREARGDLPPVFGAVKVSFRTIFPHHIIFYFTVVATSICQGNSNVKMSG
jgi:hypothetical protein